jgi:opacity protein-like surface antigen
MARASRRTATMGHITRNVDNAETLSGWTIGAGVEWAFYRNWSAKIEYLYTDVGDGPNDLATRATLNIAAPTWSRISAASASTTTSAAFGRFFCLANSRIAARRFEAYVPA